MAARDGHHDDVCLVRQGNERVAILGRQPSEIPPAPLIEPQVQAEEIRPQVVHQPDERAQVIGDRLAVEFSQRPDHRARRR